MTDKTTEKSLGALLGDLARETSTLVRQEVQLAKVETTEKIVTLARASVMLVVGGVIGFVAFEVLVAALVLKLCQSFSPALAALIVGGVLLLMAGLLALMGVFTLRKGVDPVPRQTVETLKEDAKWAKEQI